MGPGGGICRVALFGPCGVPWGLGLVVSPWAISLRLWPTWAIEGPSWAEENPGL